MSAASLNRCGRGRVPALQGLAAPHWRTDVRGAMFGLNRSTSSDDIVRATLDGIACRVYEVVMAMSQDLGQEPPHLKVDGGPSGNPYLMQMIADLFNLEVRVSAALEATAIGIANLAGVSALGISFDEFSKNWKSEKYTPKMSAADRENKLAQWNKALDAVKCFTPLEEQFEGNMTKSKDRPGIRIPAPTLAIIHITMAILLGWLAPLPIPAPHLFNGLGWTRCARFYFGCFGFD